MDEKLQYELTKKSKIAKLVKTIGTMLGVQFFIIKMEGNQIELSLLSLVGLKYVTGYSADVVGALIGIIFLIYYTVIALMAFGHQSGYGSRSSTMGLLNLPASSKNSSATNL